MEAAMYLARSKPLSKHEAEALADALLAAEELEALSASTVEIDEGAGLWQAEAQYHEAPTPGALLSAGIDPASLTIESLPARDWVAHSLAGLAPVEAGRFIVHGSHDRGRARPGGVRVEIEAATAFGTGHHPTTRACLLALDRLIKVRRPKSVLDVGSGSGVLGIAAAKAVNAAVWATDVDPEAVRVTAANARLNGVAGRMKARCAADLDFAERYDLVFANILAGPLTKLSARLAHAVGLGGTIVLSGLLGEQARLVLGSYLAHRLVLAGRVVSGDWTSLVLRRPGGALKTSAPGTGRECRARLHQSGRRGLVRISGRLRPRPSAGSRSA